MIIIIMILSISFASSHQHTSWLNGASVNCGTADLNTRLHFDRSLRAFFSSSFFLCCADHNSAAGQRRSGQRAGAQAAHPALSTTIRPHAVLPAPCAPRVAPASARLPAAAAQTTGARHGGWSAGTAARRPAWRERARCCGMQPARVLARQLQLPQWREPVLMTLRRRRKLKKERKEKKKERPMMINEAADEKRAHESDGRDLLLLLLSFPSFLLSSSSFFCLVAPPVDRQETPGCRHRSPHQGHEHHALAQLQLGPGQGERLGRDPPLYFAYSCIFFLLSSLSSPSLAHTHTHTHTLSLSLSSLSLSLSLSFSLSLFPPAHPTTTKKTTNRWCCRCSSRHNSPGTPGRQTLPCPQWQRRSTRTSTTPKTRAVAAPAETRC